MHLSRQDDLITIQSSDGYRATRLILTAGDGLPWALGADEVILSPEPFERLQTRARLVKVDSTLVAFHGGRGPNDTDLMLTLPTPTCPGTFPVETLATVWANLNTDCCPAAPITLQARFLEQAGAVVRRLADTCKADARITL